MNAWKWTLGALIAGSLTIVGSAAQDGPGSRRGSSEGSYAEVWAYLLEKYDADADGKIGLWDNKADIFASAANFLQKIGWHQGERWGREVAIPKTFDYQLANLNTTKTVNEWQALGVRTATNEDLPDSTMTASLLLPMGYNGPAFLAYRNFRAILRWNHSILYALSVGHLSDRLAGAGELLAKPITEPSLSRDDVKFIQTSLNRLGFDTGEPDGISGPKTRGAARNYQRANNKPIDGYVGYQLLQQLQAL